MFHFNITADQLILIGKVVGALISICTALGLLVRYWAYPLYQRANRNIQYLFRIAANADQIHSIIEKELTHNGGSSLKDAVRRIENNLQSTENKFHAYLSLKKEPVWESDHEGNCKWVNESYIRTVGYSLDHLKNLGWMMIVKEDQREDVEEQWLNTVGDKRNFLCRLTVVSSMGVEWKVIAHGYPVFASNGQLTGYLGIFDFDKDQPHGRECPVPCLTK
jgi:PAS domain S-box-containing protein